MLRTIFIPLTFALLLAACEQVPCDCPKEEAIVLPDANAVTSYGHPACKIEPGAPKSILKTAKWQWVGEKKPYPPSCALLVP